MCVPTWFPRGLLARLPGWLVLVLLLSKAFPSESQFHVCFFLWKDRSQNGLLNCFGRTNHHARYDMDLFLYPFWLKPKKQNKTTRHVLPHCKMECSITSVGRRCMVQKWVLWHSDQNSFLGYRLKRLEKEGCQVWNRCFLWSSQSAVEFFVTSLGTAAPRLQSGETIRWGTQKARCCPLKFGDRFLTHSPKGF